MSSIQGVARSGLTAASTWLEVSAHNVANALTPGFQPGRVDAVEAAGGGVSTTVTWLANPDDEVRADRALLAGSGTDLTSEVVTQRMAAAFFRANLAMLRTADELEATVVGLKA